MPPKDMPVLMGRDENVDSQPAPHRPNGRSCTSPTSMCQSARISIIAVTSLRQALFTGGFRELLPAAYADASRGTAGPRWLVVTR